MKTLSAVGAMPIKERRGAWVRFLGNLAFLTLAVALPSVARAGVTTLYSFTNKFDGSQPYAGLTLGSDGNFYGTCFDGGTNGFGSVFKVSSAGTLTPVYSFSLIDGETPTAALTLGNDGNFYGTTFSGGSNFYYGTVFQISNGVLNSLYSFTNGLDGAAPYAGLTEGPNGVFYGAASSGGVNNNGVIFEITSTGAFTPVYYFNGGVDGGQPRATLTLASNHLFYGTAFAGGSGNGVVFSFTADGALNPLHAFNGSTDGANPVGQLVQGANGNLYGTAYAGGTNGMGTVFQITTGGAFSVIYSFTGGSDGGNPAAGLALGSDGNFYGTTYAGGSSGDGGIFKITLQGALTPLYSFTGGNDGSNPMDMLTLGSDRNFYGTAQFGGADGDGVVFKLSTSASGPVLTSIANVSGAIEITWTGSPGQSYQAQYATNLNQIVWSNLGSPVIATNGVAVQTENTPLAPERFYRVYLVP